MYRRTGGASESPRSLTEWGEEKKKGWRDTGRQKGATGVGEKKGV